MSSAEPKLLDGDVGLVYDESLIFREDVAVERAVDTDKFILTASPSAGLNSAGAVKQEAALFGSEGVHTKTSDRPTTDKELENGANVNISSQKASNDMSPSTKDNVPKQQLIETTVLTDLASAPYVLTQQLDVKEPSTDQAFVGHSTSAIENSTTKASAVKANEVLFHNRQSLSPKTSESEFKQANKDQISISDKPSNASSIYNDAVLANADRALFINNQSVNLRMNESGANSDRQLSSDSPLVASAIYNNVFADETDRELVYNEQPVTPLTSKIMQVNPNQQFFSDIPPDSTSVGDVSKAKTEQILVHSAQSVIPAISEVEQTIADQADFSDLPIAPSPIMSEVKQANAKQQPILDASSFAQNVHADAFVEGNKMKINEYILPTQAPFSHLSIFNADADTPAYNTLPSTPSTRQNDDRSIDPKHLDNPSNASAHNVVNAKVMPIYNTQSTNSYPTILKQSNPEQLSIIQSPSAATSVYTGVVGNSGRVSVYNTQSANSGPLFRFNFQQPSDRGVITNKSSVNPSLDHSSTNPNSMKDYDDTQKLNVHTDIDKISVTSSKSAIIDNRFINYKPSVAPNVGLYRDSSGLDVDAISMHNSQSNDRELVMVYMTPGFRPLRLSKREDSSSQHDAALFDKSRYSSQNTTQALIYNSHSDQGSPSMQSSSKMDRKQELSSAARPYINDDFSATDVYDHSAEKMDQKMRSNTAVHPSSNNQHQQSSFGAKGSHNGAHKTIQHASAVSGSETHQMSSPYGKQSNSTMVECFDQNPPYGISLWRFGDGVPRPTNRSLFCENQSNTPCTAVGSADYDAATAQSTKRNKTHFTEDEHRAMQNSALFRRNTENASVVGYMNPNNGQENIDALNAADGEPLRIYGPSIRGVQSNNSSGVNVNKEFSHVQYGYSSHGYNPSITVAGQESIQMRHDTQPNPVNNVTHKSLQKDCGVPQKTNSGVPKDDEKAFPIANTLGKDKNACEKVPILDEKDALIEKILHKMAVMNSCTDGNMVYKVNLRAIEEERMITTDKKGNPVAEETIIKRTKIGNTDDGEQYHIEKRTTLSTPIKMRDGIGLPDQSVDGSGYSDLEVNDVLSSASSDEEKTSVTRLRISVSDVVLKMKDLGHSSQTGRQEQTAQQQNQTDQPYAAQHEIYKLSDENLQATPWCPTTSQTISQQCSENSRRYSAQCQCQIIQPTWHSPATFQYCPTTAHHYLMAPQHHPANFCQYQADQLQYSTNDQHTTFSQQYPTFSQQYATTDEQCAMTTPEYQSVSMPYKTTSQHLAASQLFSPTNQQSQTFERVCQVPGQLYQTVQQYPAAECQIPAISQQYPSANDMHYPLIHLQYATTDQNLQTTDQNYPRNNTQLFVPAQQSSTGNQQSSPANNHSLITGEQYLVTNQKSPTANLHYQATSQQSASTDQKSPAAYQRSPTMNPQNQAICQRSVTTSQCYPASSQRSSADAEDQTMDKQYQTKEYQNSIINQQYPILKPHYPLNVRNPAANQRSPITKPQCSPISQHYPTETQQLSTAEPLSPTTKQPYSAATQHYQSTEQRYPKTVPQNLARGNNKYQTVGQQNPIADKQSSTTKAQYPTSSQHYPSATQKPSTTIPQYRLRSQQYPATTQQSLTTKPQYPINSQRYTAASKQFSTTKQQYAVTSQQYPAARQQYLITNQQYSTTGPQPLAMNKQYQTTNKQDPIENPQSSTIKPQHLTTKHFPTAIQQSSTKPQYTTTDQRYPPSNPQYSATSPHIPTVGDHLPNQPHVNATRYRYPANYKHQCKSDYQQPFVYDTTRHFNHGDFEISADQKQSLFDQQRERINAAVDGFISSPEYLTEEEPPEDDHSPLQSDDCDKPQYDMSCLKLHSLEGPSTGTPIARNATSESEERKHNDSNSQKKIQPDTRKKRRKHVKSGSIMTVRSSRNSAVEVDENGCLVNLVLSSEIVGEEVKFGRRDIQFQPETGTTQCTHTESETENEFTALYKESGGECMETANWDELDTWPANADMNSDGMSSSSQSHSRGCKITRSSEGIPLEGFGDKVLVIPSRKRARDQGDGSTLDRRMHIAA